MPYGDNAPYDSPRKNRFIGAVQSGLSIPKAAERHGIKTSSAYYIHDKFEETGSTHQRPGAGHPAKVTDKMKRLVVRTVKKNRQNRFAPYQDISNLLPDQLSVSTISKIMADVNKHRCVARRVPRLTKASKKKRLAWARERLAYSDEDWGDIIWSDECYLCLGEKCGRVYVTRSPEEEYDEDCCISTWSQSSVRVMVWGAIMRDVKGPLVVLEYPGGKGGGMTAQRYQEQVLEDALLEMIEEIKEDVPNFKFQQDGAPSHKAKSTKNWVTQHGIPTFPHPPSSPDVSPIEPVWLELKRRVRRTYPQPTTYDSLADLILKCWEEMDQADINKYIDRMPGVVQEVVDKKGGNTRF